MASQLTLLLICPALLFTTSLQDHVCFRPVLPANVEVDGLQGFFSPGAEVALSCTEGHTPQFGPRKIVCTTSGKWTTTRFMCIPKNCPYPEPVQNGELYYEDTIYRSTVNYTCNEGYTMTGANSTVCLASGTWSSPAPECKPVTCGLAPIPQYGMIVYNKRVRGNTTDYGTTGTYTCLPPHVAIGNIKAECTASGKWTELPECRIVTCAPPKLIENGYLSNTEERDFDYMETVRYGCNGDYVLDGSLQSVCQENGEWSERPDCKAPCSVGIQRGRILYKGQRLWIKELQPNRILHGDVVSVYCMNLARKCGYAVSAQCIDGKLKIPECFEEPSGIDYTFHSSSLPSEIQQC
ncbi:hypothetical protein LDENG_00085810 [Lucifuga dentata]|nr:hypothetical protein LDENG_00085810 [Lucifuga dentata]